MLIAAQLNEAGIHLHDRGHLGLARLAYGAASFFAPAWSAPWFNRGLIAKHQKRWDDCRALNRRATELAPNDPPAWWNLGIAATALADWETARRAWSAYGIEVPDGEGAIEMDLGVVAIRLQPDDLGEVVWCRRLDPARARILSVPIPESGRGCGDTVLHDGASRGSRVVEGNEVPVFDELALLEPGRLRTFAVRITASARADVGELENAATEGEIAFEDWHSSLRWICRQCSEGTPHEHERAVEDAWEPERTVGVAAPTEETVRTLLEAWAGRGPGRAVASVECVLRRDS
jgi:hypothetical protein